MFKRNEKLLEKIYNIRNDCNENRLPLSFQFVSLLPAYQIFSNIQVVQL